MPKIVPPCKVWQWDINDTVTVEGIENISEWQVHFATVGDTIALVIEIKPDMTAYIPNQLVELGAAIYAYLYNVREERAYTETAILIPVSARPKPSDYISEPTEVLTWGQLRADIGTLSQLVTEDKTNLVAAINEVYDESETQSSAISSLQQNDILLTQHIADIKETDAEQTKAIDTLEQNDATQTQDIELLQTEMATKVTEDTDSLVNYYKKAETYNKTEIDTSLAQKQPIGDYITAAVDNLINYYKKTETYTQDEVNALVSGLTHITVQVVNSVADVTQPNIIYLVPTGGTGNDSYDEYLYVNGKPERIGSMRVDLSQYYTKSETYSRAEIDSALSGKQPIGDYATTTALTEGLNTKQPVGNYVTSVNNKTPVNGNVDIDAVSVTAGDGIDISETGVVSVVNPMDDSVVSAEKTWSSARVSQVLAQSGATKKYGFLWDKVNAKGTRLWDAAGITTDTTNFGHFGTVNPKCDNPFDSIYPWSERRVCNYDMRVLKTIVADGYDVLDAVTAWEGEDAFSYDPAEGLGVGVYTPEFWYTAYDTAEGRVFGVSGAPIDGWYYSEPIIAGRWLGVVEQLDGVSVLGCRVGIPTSDVAVGTLHTYAENAGMTVDDIYSWDAETMLQIVEYANMNTQNATGYGVSSLYRQNEADLIQEAATESTVIKVVAANAAYAIPGAIMDIGTTSGGYQVARRYVVSTAADETDETLLCVTLDAPVTVTTANYWSIHGLINVADAEIGSQSGYIGTNGRCNAYYRGRVTAGNKFYYVLGAFQEGQTNHIWRTKSRYDAETIVALDTSTCIDTGCVLPWGEGDIANAGYIGTLDLADGISAFPLCSVLGGNSSNPVGDYTSISAKGSNHVCAVGGGAAHDASTGRFCAYWYYSRGSAHWNLSASPSSKSSHRGS